MFRIYDGREQFFQWDLDRKLVVEDASITEVHFCNRTAECALPVATYKEGNLTLVNVPNLILQESFRMNVYAYDGKHTKHAARFEIVPRSKPDTYVYTETEIKTWDELYELVKQIEENGVSDATIEAAVQKYLEENDIRVDLTGYATEEFVRQEIEKIDIPEVDLSEYAKKSEIPSTEGLATEKYVDDAIANIDIPEAEGSVEEVHVGAEAPTDANIKIWVDTDADSPVATKEYVQQKVAEAKMDAAGVDLSAYYTKTETDGAIENAINGIEFPEVPETDLSGYYTKEEVDALIAAGGSEDSTVVIYEGESAEIAPIVFDEEQHNLLMSYVGAELDVEFVLLETGEGYFSSLPVIELDGVVMFEGVSDMTNNALSSLNYNIEERTLYPNASSVPFVLSIKKSDTEAPDYITRDEFDAVFTDLNNGLVETFYTKEEVDGKIANIEHPTTDLSNYYTKDEVDGKIPSLDGYAKTSDIPDVSGYQTAEEVQSAITEALNAIGVAEEVSF